MLWAHHAAKQFIYRAVVTTCPPQGTGSVTKQEDISPQEQGHRKFWDNTGSTPPPRSLLFLHGSTTTKLPGMHDLFQNTLAPCCLAEFPGFPWWREGCLRASYHSFPRWRHWGSERAPADLPPLLLCRATSVPPQAQPAAWPCTCPRMGTNHLLPALINGV